MASIARPAARWVRGHPYTVLVFVLAIAVRVWLVPITHGPDFSQEQLDAHFTLAGVNIYANPPHGQTYYVYAYLPLFLYVELPFSWLALHLHVPFTILGKLPIMAGDLAATALIAAYLVERGHRDRVVALGAALYALNPLVLYNGAFYGRFDALCVALFLLALRFHTAQRPRSAAFALWYAVAVAMKTYPAYILPWLLLREPRRRVPVLAALVVVLSAVSLPYLLHSPRDFVYDIALYMGHRLPSGDTWQRVLLDEHLINAEVLRVVSYGLLGLFVVALFAVTRVDLLTYCTVALLLFVLLSKVVYEQYFLWPMPFLIFATLDRRSRAAAAVLVLLTALGFLNNEHLHPLRPIELPAIVIVDACVLLYVATRLRGHVFLPWRPLGAWRGRDAETETAAPEGT